MKPIQINNINTNNNNNNSNDNDNINKMITTTTTTTTTSTNTSREIVTRTIKTPVLWAVGLVVYVYFILFQILSSGLSSMGYNTIPLNDRFLNRRVIKLIPNRLKKYNNIPLTYNNRSNNSNSYTLSDKRSYNTLKSGYHYSKNFIVFLSISNSDKESQTIFNKFKPIFENNQIGLTVFETENKADTYKFSYRIQQTEFDGIICVGDDNLVHDVINCILNKQDYSIIRHIPIGVIPVGKKNGFSNSLGIKSPEIAVKKIIQGNVNYIDIMSISPVKNTTQLSFPKSNDNSSLNYNSYNSYNNFNNYIDIYNTGNNNNNYNNFYNSNNDNSINNNNHNNNNNNNNNNRPLNINQNNNNSNNNNIYYREYKVYGILYIGWGAISFRDSFKPWNSNVKPWLLSTFYSKFSKFSFNNFSSSLYFLPSPHFSNNQIKRINHINNNSNKSNNSNSFSNKNHDDIISSDSSGKNSIFNQNEEDEEDNNSNTYEIHYNSDTVNHHLFCNKKSLCEGCKKQYIDYDNQGKRSSKDFSDWKIVEGLNDSNNSYNNNSVNQQNNNSNHNSGMSFFLAGNLSNISRDFKVFPFTHLSDGFLDLLISYQDDKKKLNQLIYDSNPSINCLIDDNNNNNTQPNNNQNNNNVNNNSNDKSTFYYKTKEFIFNVKNEEIPLSVDGELFNIKEFGSNTIKVQSHRALVAVFK